jgi:hypothetical protein
MVAGHCIAGVAFLKAAFREGICLALDLRLGTDTQHRD